MGATPQCPKMTQKNNHRLVRQNNQCLHKNFFCDASEKTSVIQAFFVYLLQILAEGFIMKSELDFSFLPVTCDSSKITKGGTFVACDGYAVKGIDFIPKAINAGATTIIAGTNHQKHLFPLEKEYRNISFKYVKNPRQTLAEEAAAAFNFPAQKLNFIGITGTKGKSSVTHLIEHFFKTAGKKTALIGGIANKIGDFIIPSDLTTPNSDFLQAFFAACVQQNIDTVIMEVSSHALTLDRVHGIEFEAIAFTNLFNDHLDFYSTMEAYFEAKIKLFKQLKKSGHAIINLDHPWGKKVFNEAQSNLSSHEIITLGTHNADVLLTIQSNSLKGLEINLVKKDLSNNLSLRSHNLFGIPYAYNIAIAAAVTQSCNIPNPIISEALQTFPGIPGRMQLHVLKNGARAFVDFAHNGPSMDATLNMLRPLTENLIVLFGCGGNKPKERRMSMALAAAKFADKIIVTEDNPRTEDRLQILRDINASIPENAKSKTITIQNRKEAIKTAAELANTPSSIVAILGKGHEKYQIIGTIKHHFDDYEEISKL